jgi:hypothetical protein
MAEPKDATIRAFAPEDEHKIRFLIGKTALEPLAVANRRGEQPVAALPSC